MPDDGRPDGGGQVQGAGIATNKEPRAPCQGDELHERRGQIARASRVRALRKISRIIGLFRGRAGKNYLLTPGACPIAGSARRNLPATSISSASRPRDSR